MTDLMKRVRDGEVSEHLTNIKRVCIRGRNSNLSKSSFLATCDHIENLADLALAAIAASEGVDRGE